MMSSSSSGMMSSSSSSDMMSSTTSGGMISSSGMMSSSSSGMMSSSSSTDMMSSTTSGTMASSSSGMMTSSSSSGMMMSSSSSGMISTSSTMSSSADATMMSSSTPSGTARSYEGAAVLGVTDATAFLSDTAAQNAVTAGIADIAGVSSSNVDTTFSAVVARRLYDDSRRLSGDQVQAGFTITLPATLSSSAQATAISSITSMTQSDFESTVQTKLADAGITAHNITVASFTVPTEASTTPAAIVGDAAASQGCQVRIGISLLMLSTMTIARLIKM
mmetsp:Transcript_59319/g.92379  ORF Transcript_59319/g.92379 Transcript_59319/m.92379 type:complete len:276 (-) Transcript_59319:225-1052(-)